MQELIERRGGSWTPDDTYTVLHSKLPSPPFFFAILNADIYRACTLILHMVMHKSYYIPVRSSSGFHELKQLSLVKLFLPTYSRLNN